MASTLRFGVRYFRDAWVVFDYDVKFDRANPDANVNRAFYHQLDAQNYAHVLNEMEKP